MKNQFKSSSQTRKTYIDNNGYRRFKGSNTPLHQYVAEQKLGRPLRDGEVVHHKNRDKLDNSANNLHVFGNQKAHWATHQKDAKNHGWRYSMTGKNKRPQ